MQRRQALALSAMGLVAVTRRARGEDAPEGSGAWDDVRTTLFDNRPSQANEAIVSLDAPARALDASVVPMTIKLGQPAAEQDRVRTIWLVIDENPAPVAGIFHLHEVSFGASIQTRVRVNSYTRVHAIAETSDGRLFVSERFVKAAGGCSAPAMKDPAEVEARRGRMKLKELGTFAAGQPNTVQLLISHPQYTGMQIDQLSRNWIPPDYLRRINLAYDGAPVMEIDGDISIAEDPSLTFVFIPPRPGTLTVEATDNKSRTYKGSFPMGSAT
ncbi:sulfur-oxidizing protein SoxY [Arboricoccus pini]|uniref:Sulfur-oxidizing protein SoxY n=1 Tax=Arboricoccus pini TaxID=1963835 RepID=A0A212RW46_9PROT|nr:quinoprotein dehydrogenase-associated SoxYZ-like carrier [Arboricoccus pini]SNB76952.1 sulfur-oxidizing protein SoxY [Arboricoccus pini]